MDANFYILILFLFLGAAVYLITLDPLKVSYPSKSLQSEKNQSKSRKKKAKKEKVLKEAIIKDTEIDDKTPPSFESNNEEQRQINSGLSQEISQEILDSKLSFDQINEETPWIVPKKPKVIRLIPTEKTPSTKTKAEIGWNVVTKKQEVKTKGNESLTKKQRENQRKKEREREAKDMQAKIQEERLRIHRKEQMKFKLDNLKNPVSSSRNDWNKTSASSYENIF